METGLGFSSVSHFASAQFYEYLLVIRPGTDVYNRIVEQKEIFFSEYKVGAAKKTLPSITVAKFIAKEGMEETIIKWMHRIISEQNTFNVTLNNYSGFPSHKVYARVQDHTPFRQLASSYM